MLRYIDIPLTWLVLGGVIVWGAGDAVPLRWLLGPVLGWALCGVGMALALIAAVQLLLARTTLAPHATARHLVIQGLYALSRNPIYLGYAFFLAGLCMIWQAPYMVLVVPVYLYWITLRFVAPEEHRLTQNFGASYLAYTEATRRWL